MAEFNRINLLELGGELKEVPSDKNKMTDKIKFKMLILLSALITVLTLLSIQMYNVLKEERQLFDYIVKSLHQSNRSLENFTQGNVSWAEP
jgi:hypothetical protein